MSVLVIDLRLPRPLQPLQQDVVPLVLVLWLLPLVQQPLFTWRLPRPCLRIVSPSSSRSLQTLFQVQAASLIAGYASLLLACLRLTACPDLSLDALSASKPQPSSLQGSVGTLSEAPNMTLESRSCVDATPAGKPEILSPQTCGLS